MPIDIWKLGGLKRDMALGRKRVKGTAVAREPVVVDTSDEDGRDFQFVTALARGLKILEVCSQASKSIATGELATITNLSLPNVSRVAYTLVQCGYLEFNARDRSYTLGRSAEALAARIRRRTDINSLARVEMEALARQTGFNVGMGTMAGDQMVYLDAFEGASPVGLKLQTGYQVPLVTSAMGRAYLSGLDEPERLDAIAKLKARYGSDWPPLLKKIEESISQIHTEGYCTSFGDWNKNVNAIAAPIRDLKSNILYSIVLGGPSYILTKEIMDEVSQVFVVMVDSIRSRIEI